MRNALHAPKDQPGIMIVTPVYALNKLLSLIQKLENALSAPLISQFGMEKLALPVLKEPTTMSNPKLVPFAQKD
jgi:hypothetical protein